MSYIGAPPVNRVLTSADIEDGAVKINDISFTNTPANVNLSGTLDSLTMKLADKTTLTGNLTLNNKKLVLTKLADDGNPVTLTDDGTSRTITGSGTITSSTFAQTPNASLTGMTGEIGSGVTIGSAVTGSPNLNLGNATFPAGHIIRSFYAQDDGGEVTVADPSTADQLYSELELEITGTNSTSDYLMVILYIASAYNSGYFGNALHTGVHYSTDNWASTGTALITDGNDWQMMRSVMVQSGSTAFDLIHSNTLAFRVNHPVTGTYKIRPRIKNNGSGCKFNTGHGRSTITAFEIKG